MAKQLTKPRRGMPRRAISCRAIALIAPLTLASPAMADPTIGFGLSVQFGGGQVNTGVGLRVFSDDRRDKVVASVGLDYMFGSQSWRATVGPAYLGDNAYMSLDLGINPQTGVRDFGIGIGGVNTSTPTTAAPTTAPVTAPVTPPPAPTPPPTVTSPPPPPPTPTPPSGPVLPPLSPVT